MALATENFTLLKTLEPTNIVKTAVQEIKQK
jgi:hypothetical protein